MLSAFKLRKIRLKQQKKLSKSNLCLYKNITAYIKISNSSLTSKEKEEALQQIMDMILQAQIEGKSIDLFIGKDYEVFCNSIIDEFNSCKSKSYKIVRFIQTCLIWTILFSVLSIFSNFLENGSFNLSITVKQLIDAAGMAILIIPIIRIRRLGTLSFLNFEIEINYFTKFVLMFFAFVIKYMAKYPVEKSFGADIGKYDISLCNNIIYILFVFVILGLMEGYKRKHDKG